MRQPRVGLRTGGRGSGREKLLQPLFRLLFFLLFLVVCFVVAENEIVFMGFIHAEQSCLLVQYSREDCKLLGCESERQATRVSLPLELPSQREYKP